MTYDYGQWWLVILNILLFGYFIKEAFKPRTKTDWRSFGAIMAFLAALFAEMYGFPLTIFLLTSYFGSRFDFSHNNGHLLNTLLGQNGDPHFSFLHIISYILIIGGIVLISHAWKVLYEAAKKQVLATSGLYAYLRHPQYLGFILIIIGFLLQWPTIITLLMAPILILRYLLLARREDQEMKKLYKDSFKFYQQNTPGFFPSWQKIIKRVKLNS